MPQLTRRDIVDGKIGDWFQAYERIAEAVTPPALRAQLNAVINEPIPADMDGIILYNSRVSASMALARLVSANDRASATVAALLVAGGVKPTAFDYGDDT